MSKSSMTRSFTILIVLIASVALVTADLIVSAQNTNSSTTQDEQTRGGMMTSQNANTSGTGTSRRGRRRRRRAARTTNMSGDMAGNANMTGDMSDNANTSDDTQNTNMTGDMSGNANMTGDMTSTGGGRRRRRGRRRGNRVRLEDTSGYMQNQELERSSGRQEDFAGQSYTGTVEYSEGSLSGPATLAFESGNSFTLTPEGGTAASGRYSAVTTRGYTGMTLMFTSMTPPSIVSVRLRRMGNGVSIMSAEGENRQFSFTSSGGGGRMTGMMGGRRRRRGRRMRRGGTRGGIKPPMSTPDSTPESSPTP